MNGSTRAWRKLRAQVIREEPTCRLRLAGCTGLSTTGDHIIPVSARPDLRYVRANVQGACASCNYKRGHTPIGMLDHLRCGPTQPRQHSSASALAFFDGDKSGHVRVRASIREGRNDSNCDVAQDDPPCIGA